MMITKQRSWLLVLAMLWLGIAQAQPPIKKYDSANYEKEWEDIDKYRNQGLPKSAKAAVDTLEVRIKADVSNPNQQAQAIKVLLYRGLLMVELEEGGVEKALGALKSEMERAEGVQKALLQSMLGEMYDNYLMENLYKLSQRTATDSTFKQDDIRTWDVRKVTEEAYKYYKLSLAGGYGRDVETVHYKAILTKYGHNPELNPTMRDVLLNRALKFFMSERSHLASPAYKFYVDQPEALGSAEAYMRLKLEARDTMSSQFQAMRVWQELLRFHRDDKDVRAFVHADVRRLNYMREKSILSNKDELYLKSLQALEQAYSNNEASAEVSYYIANYYAQEGSKYKPSPTDAYRYELRKAMEIINGIVAKYPNSYGAKQGLALKSRIMIKSFSIDLEHVVGINRAALIGVNYKNVKALHYRVIKITAERTEAMAKLYGSKEVDYLVGLPALKVGEWVLPDERDYQLHRVEMDLPALASGRYLVLVSYDKDFKTAVGNCVEYAEYVVSNLAYMRKNFRGENSFLVMDRISGAPLEGVEVEFFAQRYDERKSSYVWEREGVRKTDKNGYVVTPAIKFGRRDREGAIKIKLTKGDDVLDFGDSYYQHNYEEDNERDATTYFFLDRAIYRPGQTIYFKGIMVESDRWGKRPEVVANKRATITFYDVNHQKIAEEEVVTNEFGSYHGSFVAPTSGLTGKMSIEDGTTGARKDFRVEEYKRPKFVVDMKPLDKVYKLEEKVSVKGVATVYAGNKIDGGKVQYRVVRAARFPYWNWRWGYNPYGQKTQEITFGESKTDENGEFEIVFEAMADKSIPAANKPEFSYTVYVDVTDVTGETRSAQSSVRVGYVAMNISLDLANRINRDKLKDIEISSLNLNGQYAAAKGRLVIEQLEQPTKVYHDRRWDKPDYFVLSEAEFNSKFPHLAYKDEDNENAWKSKKTVFDAAFDTDKNKRVAMPNAKTWEQGTYRATLTSADKYGEKLEYIKTFTVYSEGAGVCPTPEALYNMQSYYVAEPDSTIQIDFGSANSEAYVWLQIELDGTLLHSEWIQPKGRKSFPVKIEEKYRGGLHFQLLSLQENRVYDQQASIAVPWSNKELQIEYETFRDKLLPGQDEEWRMKISGPKGDKVAAQFVAGMYDASLDAFAANHWEMSLYGNNRRQHSWLTGSGFGTARANSWSDYFNPYTYAPSLHYLDINWFGFSYSSYRLYGKYNRLSVTESGVVERRAENPIINADDPSNARTITAEEIEKIGTRNISSIAAQKGAVSDYKFEWTGEGDKNTEGDGDFGDVKVRTNLNETVFFFPQLMTDKDGKLIIKFKMNEALTKWKFMLLGHTKDLVVGQSSREVVTQKDLMVQPNAPRFFRQSDTLEFTAKISNLTDKVMKGKVTLQLFDASNMRAVDADFDNSKNTQEFSVEANRSVGVSWKIRVPNDWTSAITFRAIAKANNFSDGEENSLPVVSNRMLVVETMPLPIRAGQTKTFDFARMAEASKSTTLRHHQYTLEFTQNPAWYAVQALPYLMEYPYECTEQVFSRFYANSLSSSIANAHPRIKQVFDTWKNIDPNALKSNLHKNQELKTALLEETPWVLNAESEEQQKKNIGLLFDLNRMANELGRARDKMLDRQLGNGGFAWFPGGRDDWYITQYIVEGMGHLRELKVETVTKDAKIVSMVEKAVKYTDDQIERHYKDLMTYIKREKLNPNDDYLSQIAIHYLYARSFYPEVKVTDKGTQEAIDYFEGQAKKYWINKSMYMQGMLALAMHRKANKETSAAIVKSLKERSLNNEEMGMYWKYPSGYSWYELPIETHALMIEVFEEVANDSVAVDDLKTWLLKAKQTTHWKTTKATASACYALLRRGANWLAEDKDVQITLGGKPLDMSTVTKEAGTGYFKKQWSAQEIRPEMASVKVTNPNKVVAWGAVYWQYFEQLDKITHFKETPLKINKQLFKEVRTDLGPKLVPLANGAKLNVGDLVKVRIEIFVDRDMEYVHLKDMRASGFEPTNVLSQYKYQGGLGYYENTRDLATNFFISYLSKGTYVFEYPLRVQHKGNFSNGITTIQCMYAPEFTAHSEGIRVVVE